MQEELTIDILRQWNEKTADLLYNAYYRALVVFSKQIVMIHYFMSSYLLLYVTYRNYAVQNKNECTTHHAIEDTDIFIGNSCIRVSSLFHLTSHLSMSSLEKFNCIWHFY